MNDVQIHALGLHTAVNGLTLSRRAARTHALREALRQRKRDRQVRRRSNPATREGRDAFTEAV